MDRRLRDFVQFKDMNKIKQSLKGNPNKTLIVIDHKYKMLQMKHHEVQVECYGKKGMILFGSMEV